jgi:large subunit ribosomal protein L5
MERFREQFNKTVAPKIAGEFGFTNPMSVPKIEKVVINVGVGKLGRDQKVIESVIADIRKITGQEPVKTTARKSIAGFKLREGQIVGVVVTLRGDRMYSFLDKLINVALPRVRDFRGVKANGFDGRGNYHLGLKEHIVFPEVSSDALEHVFGMEISIVTTAPTDEIARFLLKAFSFPFATDK